jgi:hypothetical protein
MAQQKDNTGVLFANHDRKADKHPNSKGSATIGGVEYWLAGWTNTKDGGEKFISIVATPKEQQPESRVQRQLNDDDEDIPF